MVAVVVVVAVVAVIVVVVAVVAVVVVIVVVAVAMEVQQLAQGPKFLEPSSPLEEFECCLCMKMIMDSALSSCCGQHFCHSCIQNALAVNSVCPVCNKASIVVIQDKRRRRKMECLSVGCKRREEGCGWEGTWEELDHHIREECQYTLTPCPKKCGGSYQRREMPRHLVENCSNRMVVCHYCALACMQSQRRREAQGCVRSAPHPLPQ